MKTELIPIDQLAKDPANVRKHGERNLKAIRDSLRRFGAARSIVVDKNGVVRAGNGTLEAALAEGVKDVLVVKPEPGQIVAVQRDDWTDSEATAYAIADNRTAELAVWDDEALAKTLASLQIEDEELAKVCAFNEDEMNKLIPNFEPATIEEQGRLDEKAPIECPHCGKSFVP